MTTDSTTLSLINFKMASLKLLFVGIAMVGCLEALKITSCSSNPKGNRAKVHVIDVNPDTVELLDDCPVGKYTVDVKVHRSMLGGYVNVPIPCIQSQINTALWIGTCHYPDFCADLPKLFQGFNDPNLA